MDRSVGNSRVTVTVMLPSTDPFAALGDENRRTILRLLTDGERSVGDLASSMPISRPAVSRHLRLLKQAGLGGSHCALSPRRGELAWSEQDAMIEPFRLAFDLRAPQDHAFDVYTRDI